MKLEAIKTMEDIQTYLVENDLTEEARNQNDCSMVHMIFADGEHVCTKGGECFLQRNLHVFNKGVIYDEEKMFTLPQLFGTSRKLQYVVVPDGDGIFKLIKEIYLKEHPKPTEMSKEDYDTLQTFIFACRAYLELGRDATNAKIKEIKAANEEYKKCYKSYANLQIGVKSKEGTLKKYIRLPSISLLPKYDSRQIQSLNLMVRIIGRTVSGMIGAWSAYPITPETLYNCTNHSAPVDTDLMNDLYYFINKFPEFKERNDKAIDEYRAAAKGINKLNGKYDHLLT